MGSEQVYSRTGAERIAAERQRQIDAEGWTAEHDRGGHHPWQLLDAACCYAQPPQTRHEGSKAPWGWPWEPRWWKPKDRLRDLERGGALAQAAMDACPDHAQKSLGKHAAELRDWCAAEIDRLIQGKRPSSGAAS